MCAMIPMLRVSLRGCVRGMVWSLVSGLSLPAVVGEGLVGLGHLVRVVLLLHGAAAEVRRVEELGRELLAHRLLSALRRVLDDPADRQRRPPVGPDLDGHL